MTTSSHAILGVAQDHSLLSRAKALGAGMGLTPMEMDANALRLGSLPVNADGRTLAVGNVLQNDAANKSTARTYLSHGERTLDDL